MVGDFSLSFLFVGEDKLSSWRNSDKKTSRHHCSTTLWNYSVVVSWLNHYTVPITYGRLLPIAYAASMDAQLDAQTTTLTKSKPCSHVLSCLAIVLSLGLCKRRNRRYSVIMITVVFFKFPLAFLLSCSSFMPLRSVSLMWESFIYGLGFNSQTLNGCRQLRCHTVTNFSTQAETTTYKHAHNIYYMA